MIYEIFPCSALSTKSHSTEPKRSTFYKINIFSSTVNVPLTCLVKIPKISQNKLYLYNTVPGAISSTVQHDMCLEETRNGRSKSPMNDDNDGKISRRSNEIGEKSDLDGFEDDAYEGKQISRRNSSLEKNENGNFEHENESENEKYESENEGYKNKNEDDAGVNETEKEQNEEDDVKEKQQNDDQQKPSKSRMSDEDSNLQIDKTIQKAFRQ